MADTNDYLRERKKSRLRMGMIRSRQEDDENAQGSQEGQQLDEALTRHRYKKILGAVFLAVSLALCLLILWFFMSHRTYKEYKLLSQISLEGDSLNQYSAFGDRLLQYGRDGVACYDNSGTLLWNQSYEMKEPILHISGEYAAIGDRQGYSIYIFNLDGCTGQITTTLPVTRVQVASQGVVSAILENTQSNLITFYDKTGAVLDIELKTLIQEYGYPMDIGLSPDGQQLAVAYIYMDAGTMMNKVVFYNFEVGKNKQDRVVGIFMEYQSAMVGEVTFLGNENACAFADDRVDFYSLKNALSPALTKSITYEGRKILSVLHNGSYVGVVTEGEGADGASQLYVYNASGSQVFTLPVSMLYSHIEFSGDYLLIYNDTNCQMYDMGGKLVYQGALEGTITKCIAVSRNHLLQMGGQILNEIKLK